jgi:hypothetical protein
VVRRASISSIDGTVGDDEATGVAVRAIPP